MPKMCDEGMQFTMFDVWVATASECGVPHAENGSALNQDVE